MITKQTIIILIVVAIVFVAIIFNILWIKFKSKNSKNNSLKKDNSIATLKKKLKKPTASFNNTSLFVQVLKNSNLLPSWDTLPKINKEETNATNKNLLEELPDIKTSFRFKNNLLNISNTILKFNIKNNVLFFTCNEDLINYFFNNEIFTCNCNFDFNNSYKCDYLIKIKNSLKFFEINNSFSKIISEQYQTIFYSNFIKNNDELETYKKFLKKEVEEQINIFKNRSKNSKCVEQKILIIENEELYLYILKNFNILINTALKENIILVTPIMLICSAMQFIKNFDKQKLINNIIEKVDTLQIDQANLYKRASEIEKTNILLLKKILNPI